MLQSKIPVVGFAAYSGTGKTTLLTRLLPKLTQRGLRVGMVKHAHHQFEIDQPGKDSYELRKAGAREMLIASGRHWALMADTGREGDPILQEMLDRLDQSRLDLILVEGFKHEAFPKIELYRPALGKPLIHPDDPDVVALACDEPITPARELPLLDLNDPQAIADFIIDYTGAKAAE